MRTKIFGYGLLILALSLLTACLPRIIIGGSVTGLTGTGLVLQNNGGDDLTISINGDFSFKTPVATTAGGLYAVTVKTQPSGQACMVSNGSGTATVNVSSVSVQCFASELAAPIGVFPVSGANQVTLSWSPVNGATSYNIYWGTTPGITTASNKVTSVTSPYLQTALTAGSTYYYRVSAANPATETLSTETFSFVYTGGDPVGSFNAAGNLTTARQEHTATLLSNGKVLVVGGHSQITYYTSAELYDPATSLFSATTNSMATARYGHTATLLPNGKVLVAGGYNGTILAGVELYDPVTGLFSAANNMAAARTSHTATLLPNGKVLIVGGSNAAGFLASTEIYDSATGLFSSTGSMSVARRNHTATLLADGRVLVTGGQNGSDFLASAEIYDPVTGLFSAANSMTTGRVSHRATLLPNGKVLVTGGVGGTSASAIYNSNAELYDPVAGSFSLTGSMPTARWLHAATLLPNGKVLVSGGRNGGGGASALANAELYDPATGIFIAASNMVTARQYHTATLLSNGNVLVTGGFNGGTSALSNAELFQ